MATSTLLSKLKNKKGYYLVIYDEHIETFAFRFHNLMKATSVFNELKTAKNVTNVFLTEKINSNDSIHEGITINTVGRYKDNCANFKSGGVHLSIPIWSCKTFIAKKNYKGEMKWFLKSYWGNTIASKNMPKSLILKAHSVEGEIFLPGIVQYQKIEA